MKNTKEANVAVGDFGPIYRQFKKKPKEAILFLKNRKLENVSMLCIGMILVMSISCGALAAEADTVCATSSRSTKKSLSNSALILRISFLWYLLLEFTPKTNGKTKSNYAARTSC